MRMREGYCKMTQRWVPRDTMIAVTMKTFQSDGTELRLTFRFSPEGYAKFRDLVSVYSWENELRDSDSQPQLACE